MAVHLVSNLPHPGHPERDLSLKWGRQHPSNQYPKPRCITITNKGEILNASFYALNRRLARYTSISSQLVYDISITKPDIL